MGLGNYCDYFFGVKGDLLRLLVYLPNRESILLRVLANGKITHSRHGGLWFTNTASELLDLRHGLRHRRHIDIDGDRMPWMHALHQSAVGRSVRAAGIQV